MKTGYKGDFSISWLHNGITYPAMLSPKLE